MSGAVHNLIDRFYGPVSPGALSGKKFAFLFQGAAPEQFKLGRVETCKGEVVAKRYLFLKRFITIRSKDGEISHSRLEEKKLNCFRR